MASKHTTEQQGGSDESAKQRKIDPGIKKTQYAHAVESHLAIKRMYLANTTPSERGAHGDTHSITPAI